MVWPWRYIALRKRGGAGSQAQRRIPRRRTSPERPAPGVAARGDRRGRPREGHRAARPGAGPAERGHGHDRRGRCRARAGAPHREHGPRLAGVGHGADGSAGLGSRRTARRPCPAHGAAPRRDPRVERRHADQRRRGLLRDAADRPARVGRRDRRREPERGIADGRLLPGPRGGTHLRIHTRR